MTKILVEEVKSHQKTQASNKSKIMKPLYHTFDLIAIGSVFGLFIALLIAFYRFRVINSTVISTVVTLMSYSLMEVIHDPLLTTESREAWYGTWTFLYGISVWLLYKLHDLLKINLAKVTNKVAFTFCAGMFMQIARYLDRQYFGGEYLEQIYPIAINTINIALPTILLITVIKDKKEKLVGLYV